MTFVGAVEPSIELGPGCFGGPHSADAARERVVIAGGNPTFERHPPPPGHHQPGGEIKKVVTDRCAGLDVQKKMVMV